MASEDHDTAPLPSSKPVPPPAAKATADRGVSPIAGRFGGRPKRLITLAAFGLGCSALLFATWDRGGGAERADARPVEAARQLTPFEPARPREEPRRLDSADRPADDPTLDEAAFHRIPALETGSRPPRQNPQTPSLAEERRALAQSARRAPVLAYSRPTRDGAPEAVSRPSSPSSETAPPNALDQLRQAAPLAQVHAGRLPDRNLLITAGAALPCILQTAMDSATPGLVTCVIPIDIYSDSGGVILLERGTRVLGQYHGDVQQGRDRLFVLWTRAVTPQGVAIALGSPAADALGRSGFDGEVNTHFWTRFGGALLLSIVDDGLSAAAGHRDDFASAVRGSSEAAGVALQNSVGVTPTLRKAQGGEVTIFVAQDLNFAGVYQLRSR